MHILQYTNGLLTEPVKTYCWNQLQRACGDIPLTVVSPSDPGPNCNWVRIDYLPPWSPRSVWSTIVAGLQTIPPTEYVHFAEHDVLYSPANFEETPAQPGTLAFNQSVLRLSQFGYFAYTEAGPKPGVSMLSLLSGWQPDLLAAFSDLLKRCEAGEVFPWAEPYKVPYTTWSSSVPAVDIRHGFNTTGDRASKHYYQYNPNWGLASDHINAMRIGQKPVASLHKAYLVKTSVVGNYPTKFQTPPLVGRSEYIDYEIHTDGTNAKLNVYDTTPYRVITNSRPEGISPRRFSRFHKLECDLDHEWTIWHDDNLCLIDPVGLLAFCQTLPADIYLFRHNKRGCAYQEATEVINTGTVIGDAAESLKAQMRRYEAEGFPRNAGLWELGLFVVRNSPHMRFFLNDWLDRYLLQGHDRDQICFPYLLWRYADTVRPAKIPGTVYANPWSNFYQRARPNAT